MYKTSTKRISKKTRGKQKKNRFSFIKFIFFHSLTSPFPLELSVVERNDHK